MLCFGSMVSSLFQNSVSILYLHKQLNWKTGNAPKKTTSESDTWARLFTAHLRPNVLACLMSLALEERDALQYESKVWCTSEVSSPPHSELYGANAEANERRLSRPTDECFPRMPQSSDGFQARDERIYYGEWWTLCLVILCTCVQCN